MKVLVTGGCGFIGSNLSIKLASLGYETHILDLATQPALPLPKQAKIHKGSITDPKEVDSLVSGCAFVFHQAAQISVVDSIKNPKRTHEINVEGTRNVLESCRKHNVKRVVLASSAAVYGDAPGLPKKETDIPKPISPYGESKLQNESDARKYLEEYGLETICLRYFNVYGPGQKADSPYSGVISRFLDCAIHNKQPTIFGDGKQTRDFVFVEDVVNANVLATEAKRAAGEVFNIGTGKEVSLLELWKTIKTISGCKLEPKFEPKREGDIYRSVASIEKARDSLSYSPVFGIKKGLGKLVQPRKPA